MKQKTKGLFPVTLRTIASMVALASLCGAAACSKKEQPKPQAKPSVEVVPAVTSAPPAPATSAPQPGDSSKAGLDRATVAKTVGQRPERHLPAEPELVVAARKDGLHGNRIEFSRKMVAAALVRKAQERTTTEISLGRLESEARAKDPAVKSAYDAWDLARSAYAAACATAIAGHADLSREMTGLRTQVDRDLAAGEGGQGSDTNALAQALQRLDDVSRALAELERKALFENSQPAVMKAHGEVAATYESYRKALGANAAYRTASDKRDVVLSEYTNLLTRQGELSAEN